MADSAMAGKELDLAKNRIEQGAEAAKFCALNILAQLKKIVTPVLKQSSYLSLSIGLNRTF